MARDQALAREAEIREEQDNYPVVKATIGAVGDGQPSRPGYRERKEVCLPII